MPLTPLLYDLTLLYLALTYGADGHLAEVELDEMHAQLEKWAPGINPTRLDHIVNEAMLGYTNGLEGRRIDDLLTRLYHGLEPPARRQVLDDLRSLARADSTVHSEEVSFIKRVEAAWADEAEING